MANGARAWGTREEDEEGASARVTQSRPMPSETLHCPRRPAPLQALRVTSRITPDSRAGQVPDMPQPVDFFFPSSHPIPSHRIIWDFLIGRWLPSSRGGRKACQLSRPAIADRLCRVAHTITAVSRSWLAWLGSDASHRQAFKSCVCTLESPSRARDAQYL